MTQTCLVTISYAPDFQRCKRLCHSVDQFVKGAEEHLIICPKSDAHLFETLSAPHRRILYYQDLLPRHYRKIPLLKKCWLDPGFYPVRGWIMQQLLKIASHTQTDADILFFLDSDIQFVKPFNTDCLVRSGDVRIYRVQVPPPSDLHNQWQEIAEELLGLDSKDFRFDYIGPLTCWKRDNVARMVKQVEKTTGKAWHKAIGRKVTFSEYILYGTYVDRCLGNDAEHFIDNSSICYNLWDRNDYDSIMEGKRSIPDNCAAMLIQSNIGLDNASELALISRLTGQ